MKKLALLLTLAFAVASGVLLAGPEQLCGIWESQDGLVQLTLLSKKEGSTLQMMEEGTLLIFPITWTASPKFLQLHFTGEADIRTNDPLYQLTGPPKPPRRSSKLPYKIAKDGTTLTIEKRVFRLA